MVTRNMVRTHEEKYIFFGDNTPICDCSRSNQMPLTGQLPEITPYVRDF